MRNEDEPCQVLTTVLSFRLSSLLKLYLGFAYFLVQIDEVLRSGAEEVENKGFVQRKGVGRPEHLPMAKVMALSLLRTSFTTMLFCKGVDRQQSTERHCLARKRNLSSRFFSRAKARHFPSMTRQGPWLVTSGYLEEKAMLRLLGVLHGGTLGALDSMYCKH